MWVCEQQSSCSFSDPSCSTLENLAVFIRAEWSSAASRSVNVFIRSHRAVQPKGSLGWDRGTENTAGGRQNFSDDTEITRKSQGQPDTWSTGSIYDPATAGAVSDTIMRDASLDLSVLTSPPPNLCPINFARTDNFFGISIYINILSFILL